MNRYRVAYLLPWLLAAAVDNDSTRAQVNPRRWHADELRELIRRLEPLHEPLAKTRPGDWLASHKEEGQTFEQYVLSRPVVPSGKRHKIYIQPIGEFTAKQREILQLTTEFVRSYFNRPVVIQSDLPGAVIPARARRVHPEWHVPQILTSYVLDDLLKPRLPADAAAYLALTTSDLWPGEGWNFVFGQASLVDRVGVWSIYRNGDPSGGPNGFRECLGRTLRTATHETGHMFSLKHCTLYKCNMCGSNHRDEADSYPLYLCPQCTAKICWATGAEPLEQFELLAAFCQQNGLDREAQYYAKAIGVLRK